MLSQMTIDLLDEMTDAGLTDDAFGFAHHWREDGKRETIKHHREYCESIPLFCRILIMSVSTKTADHMGMLSDLPCRNPAIFSKLAEAAYCLIPAGDARHPAATSF